MTSPVIHGLNNLPDHPTLAYVNRVDLRIIQALEQAMGRVAWLVDASCMPGRSIMGYLLARGARGIQGNMSRISRELLADRIHDKLREGYHVVLISGRSSQARGALCDVPTPVLSYLDDSTLPVLPIYAAYTQSDVENAFAPSPPPPAVAPSAADSAAAPEAPAPAVVDTAAPPSLYFLPRLRAGKAMAARVRSAWMEASADHFAAHPLLQSAFLPRLLVTALVRHKDTLLHDGVDDSTLSYGKLLALALMLARRLRKETRDKRLGIILPPGKRSAIANLACLLAGISPVNVNYTLGKANVQRQIRQAGINRFITEERFRMVMSSFAWPSQRDLIPIDQELLDIGRGAQSLWSMLIALNNPAFILNFLQLPESDANAEAALLFTSGTEEPPRAVPMTHRMLLASLLQLQNRLNMQPGQRVLSALPFHHSLGFVHGLLLPLLFGYSMVTYPDPGAGIRLATIISSTQVRLVPASPAMLRGMLAGFEKENHKRLKSTAPALCHALQEDRLPELFSHLHYVIAGGGPLSEALAHKARVHFNVELLSAYTLAEAAPLAALNLPPCEGGRADADGQLPPTIPSCGRGTVGAPLPGLAVRITELGREGRLLPPGVPGLIWLKGANLAPQYLGAEEGLLHAQWYCTGDVGFLDDEGMLTIAGRRMRFSRIEGELVPHERAEAVLASMYKIPSNTNPPRIAVIAVPDPKEGEKLVLLSSLHKNNADYRHTTMCYNFRNAGFPEQWTPKQLICMRYLPTRADGSLDYPQCVRLITQHLNEVKGKR